MLSFLLAFFLSSLCTTPTSWAERIADGSWIAVCGDADGSPL